MSKYRERIDQLLREACKEGPISYRDYIELALYAPGCGYYARDTIRVGRAADRDFYTAESLGRVFGQLIVGAAMNLLGPDQAAECTFVEIAAEPGCYLLDTLQSHPFAGSRVIRRDNPLHVDGPVILFANEWLDALPFHRLLFKEGQWRERGVFFDNEALREVLLDHPTPAAAKAIEALPLNLEEGYQLDLPLEAEAAVEALLLQNWTGLLLLFDYGKTREALLQDCPNGTARTYYRHKQGINLLELPGEKDMTCDLCWTPMVAQLQSAGLRRVTLESQESFLIQRASKTAEAIVTRSVGQLSRDRQTLMELIHPAHMGQRFQVLWALR